MYSVGAYFIECLTEHRAGDGWTASARTSRRNDYRKHDDVPKAVFDTAIECETRHGAECAPIEWARAQLAAHVEEIEMEINHAWVRMNRGRIIDFCTKRKYFVQAER